MTTPVIIGGLEYVPFIERVEGTTYKCEICLDYGGLLEASGKLDTNFEPLCIACDCGAPDDD